MNPQFNQPKGSTSWVINHKAVARAANVPESAVIFSSETTVNLDNKAVIYDETAQKIWGKPSGIPNGAKIISVSGSNLTYTGPVTVSLIPYAGSAEELREELSSDAGSDLVYYRSVLADAVERSLSSHLYEHVSVKDFGAVGDWNPTTQTGTDDSLAFIKACKTVAGENGRNVFVPPGNYLVMNAQLSSNVRIFGCGTASSLFQKENIDANVAILGTNIDQGGNPDWSFNTSNVAIDNLRLVRTNRTTYVSSADIWQQYHLIYINATTKWSITNCTLEGFNGDGIYVAGGIGTTERHNLDGFIHNCHFNGVDNQNRNGISVIDCEGLLISNCVFRNVSNQYQPGPIDVEPNANTFHRVRDIKIIFNRFVLCKGMAAGVSLVFPDVAYASPPTGFLILGNEVDGGTGNTSFGILLQHNGDATGGRDHQVRVLANRITRVARSYNVFGMANVLIKDNVMSAVTGGDLIGFGSGSRKNVRISILNNTWKECATTEGIALAIYTADYLRIEDNWFINCGLTDNSNGNGITFKSGATTNYVTLKNNTFQNNGRMTSSISAAAHNTTAANNVNFGNNHLGVSGNDFPAVVSDEVETAWTPVIYGNTAAGVGTYSVQQGRYHRVGKFVHFRCEITTTAHTGSGIVTVSLPTLADTSVPIETMVSARAAGAGIDNVGNVSGRIYNVVGSGTAGCRLMAAATDAYCQFAAGGVMTIRVSGMYKMP